MQVSLAWVLPAQDPLRQPRLSLVLCLALLKKLLLPKAAHSAPVLPPALPVPLYDHSSPLPGFPFPALPLSADYQDIPHLLP